MNPIPKITTNDDDSDDDADNAVAEYFKQIDQCDKLPDAILFQESTEVQKMNLKVGKQIRIYQQNDDGEKTTTLHPDIYVITSITRESNTNLITKVGIKSTVDNNETKIIDLNLIYNIVNINPNSLYIDENFLERIITVDTCNLDEVTKLKYALHSKTIAFMRQQQFDKLDLLVPFREETVNIATAEGAIEKAKIRILNLPNDTNFNDLIIKIKNYSLNPSKKLTGCYYIQYLNTVLDYSGIDPKSKDSILNNYIFLCECLSATVIAGVIQAGCIRRVWIFNILYIFLESMLKTPGITSYIITPAITLYLYTNMDTIYLSTNYLVNGINDLLSIILCSITTAIDAIPKNNNDDDSNDSETVASSKTFASISSSNTLITLSTFPSLSSIKSLYDSQNVNDINHDDHEKTYSQALSGDLKIIFPIITQNNSDSQGTVNSSLSSLSSLFGGKIKRSRITKKHKRMTIRGSKRSKKMKGGKRTRSTKKRRVVRRKKCNTKRR